jgi:hypothetical protein
VRRHPRLAVPGVVTCSPPSSEATDEWLLLLPLPLSLQPTGVLEHHRPPVDCALCLTLLRPSSTDSERDGKEAYVVRGFLTLAQARDAARRVDKVQKK